MTRLKQLNSAWWLFMIVGIFYYIIGIHAAMLVFVLFWQFVTIKGIVKSVKLLQQSKSGVYADGKLISYDKRTHADDRNFVYVGIIEFYWPNRENRYQIEHVFEIIDVIKAYKVWVNTESPKNSIVVEPLHSSWWSTLVFLILITLGLFVIDYYLFIEIL